MANKDREQQHERDTHFAGYARALAAEIADTDGWMLSEVEKLIARRAYDLVFHTIENTAHIDLDRLETWEHVLRIPDMSELPEEKR